jgi:hypothetical protein
MHLSISNAKFSTHMQTFFFAMKTNRRMPIIRGILSKAIAQ